MIVFEERTNSDNKQIYKKQDCWNQGEALNVPIAF